MSQQNRVVDLSLSKPGLFISGGEDFHGNTFSLPLTPPHFTETALTYQSRTKGNILTHTLTHLKPFNAAARDLNI